MASEKELNAENAVAIIFTEGKTDWQHLKKAKEKLHLSLDISFYAYTHRMGDSDLLDMCKKYARQPYSTLRIFVFDRDNPKIIGEVSGKDEEFKDWGNNVFSFAIPVPDHRKDYENISIEFYYTDDEIKTKDSKGRRLFLTSEFDEKTGNHKTDHLIHVLNQKDLKGLTEEKKAKIVDPEIGVVSGNKHIALSKAKFTKNICDDIPPFNNFNFEPFRKIFDIIEAIIQSTQPEQSEEGLLPRLFIGREEKLAEFKELLKRNRPISIEGLGGIGKTVFAERCIKEFELEHRAIWFDCTPESKLDSLIATAGFPDVLKGENKTERAKYSGFADLIERAEKIIFLDDFQQVTDPSFAKFLRFVDKRLRKAKIVLIAREHPEVGVLTSPIHLRGLDDDSSFKYAKQIIENNYPDINVSDQDLETVCKELKGHPLAIELAIYLLDFGKSPENIVQAVVEYEDEELLAHRLLDEIFDHPKSTPEEKEFMLAFSVFRGKVKEKAINSLFEGKNFTSTIRKLKRKLMLIQTNGLYETHPLVREFCYDRIPDKKEWHQKAVVYFKTERTEQLDPVLEEKIYYHLAGSEQWQEVADLIRKQGERFISSGNTNALKEMMDRATTQGIQSPQFYIFYGDIAQIIGEWDEALNFFKQAFSLPEADEKVQAEGRIKYGEMLYRRGEVKASLSYFEESYKICKDIRVVA